MYYPSGTPYPALRNIMVDLSKMKPGVGNPPADGIEDGFPTFDFDKTTDEEVFAIFYGPLDWMPGSDAIFHISFFGDTAPVGAESVVWGIEYKSINGTGNFDFSSGTTTVLETMVVTAGTPANDKKTHKIELTVPASGLIEGGILMVRIYRDANHGSDTFDADIRVFDVHIDYVAGSAGQAV